MSGYWMVDQSQPVMPKTVDFLDVMIPYQGAVDDPKYIWGAYGTSSSNSSLYLAERYASKFNRANFHVTVWYLVPGYHDEDPRGGISLSDPVFLHLGRLNSKLRDEVREIFMETVLEERGRKEFNLCSKMRWEDFIAYVPDYVRRLFEEYSNLSMIMHPVRQLYDENFVDYLYMATAKNIPSSIVAAEVRYVPDVQVYVGSSLPRAELTTA